MRSQDPTKNQNRSNINKAGQNNNNRKIAYMVVPYSQGFSESINRSCKEYGIQVHFKAGLTIKNFFMARNYKDHILKKVESYTDINVMGWSVMRSILENQQEHLLRGSKNTKRLLPQYMTILTSQLIMLL